MELNFWQGCWKTCFPRAAEDICSGGRDLIVLPDFIDTEEDAKSKEKRDTIKRWMNSIRCKDPRYRLLKFFTDVAREGAKDVHVMGIRDGEKIDERIRGFQRASVFTVWRPCSKDAIRKLVTGDAVGKGLDIKGKSAKAGQLSGFVPFLQIHDEAHKTKIRTLPKDATMRLFYGDRQQRDGVARYLTTVLDEMIRGYTQAGQVLAQDEEVDETTLEKALERYNAWDMKDPSVVAIDDYANNEDGNDVYGIEIPERLFWEAYVMRQDIHRGPEYDTRRPSQPDFQDMNFKAMRGYTASDDDKPRPVVWQYNTDDPTCPLTLLMAYEEGGRVKPVVSDFDCFLVGTRGVTYEKPLPDDQLKILEWCVTNIGKVLDAPASSASWTARWLEVLKTSQIVPNIPDYGYADPKSYAIMKHAVTRLGDDGSVRHGSESFNYYFPQELDEEFLVISDSLPGHARWQYVDVNGLQSILMSKIDEGFTFPLNPKWVLCDPGWKSVYDKLLSSEGRNVQDSVRIWFPEGIRAEIEAVHKSHPEGFQLALAETSLEEKRSFQTKLVGESEGTAAMDLAEQELNRYRTIQRAKIKMRAVLRLLGREIVERKKSSESGEGGSLVGRDLVKEMARKQVLDEESEPWADEFESNIDGNEKRQNDSSSMPQTRSTDVSNASGLDQQSNDHVAPALVWDGDRNPRSVIDDDVIVTKTKSESARESEPGFEIDEKEKCQGSYSSLPQTPQDANGLGSESDVAPAGNDDGNQVPVSDIASTNESESASASESEMGSKIDEKENCQLGSSPLPQTGASAGGASCPDANASGLDSESDPVAPALAGDDDGNSASGVDDALVTEIESASASEQSEPGSNMDEIEHCQLGSSPLPLAGASTGASCPNENASGGLDSESDHVAPALAGDDDENSASGGDDVLVNEPEESASASEQSEELGPNIDEKEHCQLGSSPLPHTASTGASFSCSFAESNASGFDSESNHEAGGDEKNPIPSSDDALGVPSSITTVKIESSGSDDVLDAELAAYGITITNLVDSVHGNRSLGERIEL